MPLYRAELLAKKPLRYAALIHDVSQVLHLPFDYDDGSYARDRSGHGNHCTIYGATLATGKIGMARSFDGVDDHVKGGSWTTTNTFTYEVLVFSREKKSQWGAFLSVSDWPNISLGTNPDNRYRFTVTFYDGTEYYWAHAVGSEIIFDWIHLTGTYDGSAVRLYENGSLVSEHIVPEYWRPYLVSDSGPFVLAVHWGPGYYENCIMDFARVYNRALSLDEIRMLMYRRW